jgi:parallel beta-helix repeat protein
MRSCRKLIVFVLIGLLGSLLTGILPLTVLAQASLRVHNLDTGYSYTSIQEAIDDVSTLDGHVIQIDAGVYYEHVNVSKAVSLVGENPLNTVVDGQGNGTVINVATLNVTVAQLTVRNSGSTSGNSGIRVRFQNYCNITGNTIEGNYYGIWLQSCDSPIVSGNDFLNNSNAVYVDSSMNGVISANHFSTNDFAVWLGGVELVNFHSNNISDNNYAVWVAQSSNLSIDDNQIVDNSDGVSIFNNSNTIRLSGNTLSANNGYAIFFNGCLNSSITQNDVSSKEKEAIYVQNSHGNNLSGNVVSSNGYDGIHLFQSDDNMIDENVIIRGEDGIAIYSSANNVVSGNELSGNDQGILLSGSQASEVRQNNVSTNNHGIQLSNSHNVTLVGNNVTNNVNEGVYLALSSNNTLVDNHISDDEKAIILENSNDNDLTANYVSKCSYGLSLEESRENTIANNTLSFVKNYSIVFNASGNNTLFGNSAFNNTVGMRFEQKSENNPVSNNKIFNNIVGVDVEASNGNSWTNNDVSTNRIGMQLLTSSNNSFTGNTLYGNNVGLVLNDSDGNSLLSNVLTGNTDSVRFLDSYNNTVELNVVSTSGEVGIYSSFSSYNVFLHNSFLDSATRVRSENSSNFWDDGVEGNFWGDEGLVDADKNGIADSPIVISDGEKDGFPLMAPYAQQTALIDGHQFVVGIVCNSSISDFRYFRGEENSTTRISFRVGEFNGMSFCRIAIPRVLIQPPFDVVVDNSPPLYQSVVGSNNTHTWLYFSFSYIAGDVRIANAPPAAPFWAEYWFWGLVVLALVVGVLGVSVFMFYRRLGSYRRTIEEVERKLKEREFSPLELARRQFGADVERRSVKIGKFEEKYGIRIRPRESLDDIFRRLKKKEEDEKEEVNG